MSNNFIPKFPYDSPIDFNGDDDDNSNRQSRIECLQCSSINQRYDHC